MRLAVVSHKECVLDPASGDHYTDGGFPLQMRAISELFTETRLLVPCAAPGSLEGLARLDGDQISVVPLKKLEGRDLRRKLNFLGWFFENGRVIWNEIRQADAVHAPIPGDVGTIGLVFALIQRKPLFVRHCGNWTVQKTAAEKFWKWCMETFAGGTNVMLATGGGDDPPSNRNLNVKWIFSTSLSKEQIANARSKTLPVRGPIRLIIACRQERNKGTDIVLRSFAKIRRSVPNAVLDVVGGGSLLPGLKELAAELRLEDSVTFHGKVTQAEVLNLLASAHIFCYPTTASEGFPKVVAEALANGLPVVTTRVSVLPQVIREGCGVLIEPTPDDLATAVVKICIDEKGYAQMSAAAVKVASRFTLERWRDLIAENLDAAWSPIFQQTRKPVPQSGRSSV